MIQYGCSRFGFTSVKFCIAIWEPCGAVSNSTFAIVSVAFKAVDKIRFIDFFDPSEECRPGFGVNGEPSAAGDQADKDDRCDTLQ